MSKIIIDTSALLHAAHATTKLMLGDQPVGAIYGTLKYLRVARQVAGGKMIALHDGRSWRKDFFPEYKSNRVTTEEDAQRRVEIKQQRRQLSKFLTALGITQVIASNMEADDLAWMMVRSNPGENVVMVTRDHDWLQLVDERVMWYSPIQGEEFVTPRNFKEKTDFDSTLQFTQAKALMGDKGDDVPPVGGIGHAGCVALMQKFGSVEGMMNESIMPESRKWPKKFRDFVDSTEKQDAFKRNMRLVNLRDPNTPKPEKLTIVKGDFNRAAFEEQCHDFAFQSIIMQMDNFIAPFAPEENT